MDFLKAAKDAAKHRAKNVYERVHEETAGVTSKREKVRILGSLVGKKVAVKAGEAGTAVSRAAADYHDQVLIKQQDHQLQAPISGFSCSGVHLCVELFAAADLRPPSLGEPDTYAMLVIGARGKPWAVKSACSPTVRTPVALRQRHPRWGEVCMLPVAAGGLSRDAELTVRVMNAFAARAHTVLGEARLPIGAIADQSGDGTFRLLGGGFASLSLRWSTSSNCRDRATVATGSAGLSAPDPLRATPERATVSGVSSHSSFSAVAASPADERDWPDLLAKSPFEGALAFWAAAAAAGGNSTERFRNVLSGRQAAGDAGVNEVILQAPLAAVFNAEPLLRVIDALTTRIDALGSLARSRVIGALQERLPKGVDGPLRLRVERLVHDLLCTAQGDALVKLKALVDTAGIGNDLMAACAAISSDHLQASLLDHFRAEARKLVRRPTHVLSDIDMTIWVGVFGTGGPKFPKGAIPGALSLFDALGGRITFLSARPPMWEAKTRGALLDDIGIAEATLLQGTLQNVAMTLVNVEEAHRGMGEQKGKVFNEFSQLHPEARFVFFGDSGEGDVDFALQFMRVAAKTPAPPDRVALIHDVVAADGVVPKTSAQQRADYMAQGVFVFDTYVGAAVHLYELGFLDEVELHRATQRCADEFAEINAADFKSPEIYDARCAELNRDSRAANAALSVASLAVTEAPAASSCPPTGLASLVESEREAGGYPKAIASLESLGLAAPTTPAGSCTSAPKESTQPAGRDCREATSPLDPLGSLPSPPRAANIIRLQKGALAPNPPALTAKRPCFQRKFWLPFLLQLSLLRLLFQRPLFLLPLLLRLILLLLPAWRLMLPRPPGPQLTFPLRPLRPLLPPLPQRRQVVKRSATRHRPRLLRLGLRAALLGRGK